MTTDLRDLQSLLSGSSDSELSSLTISERQALEQLLSSQRQRQLEQRQQEQEAAAAHRRLINREKVARHRAALREIGEIPAVADPAKRALCDRSLKAFLEHCFPDIFHLEFSAAHLDLIAAIERAATHGGYEAFACERGFGKTQLSIGAAVWGCLTGRVRYALIIGANADMATAQREGIKRRLETSPPLFDLYPEICYPMRTLAGSQKNSATYRGELLRIRSRPDLVLPRIPGAPGSEAVISCTGIDSGSIRGRYYDRADGTTVRPELVMLDDPQDDNTAKQPKEVESRSKKIRQAVAGTRGPGEKLAILMPCTVIAKRDLAYEFTDRDQRPEWSGRRVPAMPRMPDDLQLDHPLWHHYDELRREDLAGGDKDRKRATQYYLDNREAMSRGAEITWPSRVEKGCADALQGLMDKYLSDRMSFLAEQQQDPQGEDDLSIYLDYAGILSRYNKIRRGQIPSQASILLTGIDVQEHLLYWTQIAWSDQLTGWIVERETFPRQPVADFHHLRPPRTIHQWARTKFPLQQMSWEEEHSAAIVELLEQLPQPKGLTMGPIMIDNRWHKAQDVVHRLASDSRFSGRLIPSGGLFISGNEIPISSRKMQPGSKRIDKAVEWYTKREGSNRRMLLFDANFYRSQLQKGLAADPGLPGSITYNGTAPDTILANHLAAKVVKKSAETKREVEVWQNKPGIDQDHWLDCCVLCRVGAELAGFRATGERKTHTKKRKLTQADLLAKLDRKK